AAVVPGAAELWLLQDAAGASAEALDACAGAGILVLTGGAMAFRHELARRAVEDEIAPVRRRALDRAVLQALEAHGGADPARLAPRGDRRWRCRLLWWRGRGPEAETAGERAVEVLERLPASRELAMALSTLSQLAMLADRNDEAIALGRRAVGLGRRLGDDEI